ncbi:family 78 glycoside hydrolase catalytic domain [Micromonospora sp. NPDC093277]|uniref:family 78 glycoside hydrolase catalytic domain n=1 Tax=Micromonospora sp. NPDC093277 TaxID=3364291 RepID=UPI0038244BBA
MSADLAQRPRKRARLALASLLVVALSLAPAAAVASPGVSGFPSPPGAGRLAPLDLRVEGTSRPLGIDDPAPSLSWRLESRLRDAQQSGYRIIVATAPDRLVPGRADVWDSGRVESTETIGIPYDGPALESSTRYYWTVQVRDSRGQASDWSPVSWWETGLLDDADWQGAAFVGPDTAAELMWRDFNYEADFTIDRAAASFLFRVRDSANFYMWQINAVTQPGSVMLRPHVNRGGRFSNLDDIDLGPVLTPQNLDESHHIRITASGAMITTWLDGVQVDRREDNSLPGAGTLGFRASSTAGQAERARYDNLKVTSPTGETLFTDDFSTNPDPYFPGTPIVDGQLAPTSELTFLARDPASPLLRSDFEVTEPVASARAYVYGLGLYELQLNGHKVGDRVLTPTNGQYATHALYDTYDVTDVLRSGENAVGLWLADGYGQKYNPYAWRFLGEKRVRMLIRITHVDGTIQHITTGPEDWSWSTGPIIGADLYHGEAYDARLERPGWSSPGFDDRSWKPVTGLPAPQGRLVGDPIPPRRVVQTLHPIALDEPKPGVFVFDLGQNIAGWARLRVSGKAGAAIRMRAAEEVYPDGSLDTRTNRNAEVTDTYILKGGAPETYEPRFTYHGFRYVEVTGFPGRPTLDSIEGRVVHADVESTATFDSSDELLNAIWRNNRWSIVNNSMSTPTDTPVRDERTPPAMDVQAYADASTREFRMDTFYAKYLRDLPPGTALPTDDVKSQYPDMAGGQVSLVWTLYEQYGDPAVLAEHYDDMVRFIDRNVKEKPDLIWPNNEGFGDWCPPVHGEVANGGMGGPGVTSCFSEVSLVNTALWYRQARDLAAAAAALGKTKDKARFEALAGRIRDAFNEKFLSATGDRYGSGRMTTSVLPLAFGMVPEANLEAVGRHLVRTILVDNEGHLDTGIFGTRHLMDALAAIDRMDVAMTVLGKRTYPSFGFQIENGGTTPWEQWVYNAPMITHDHAMFAGISTSFFTRLGGIVPNAPGYAAMTVAPLVPQGLDHVSVSQDTVRGTVSSSWQRSGRSFHLTVEIPANTTARVRVPRLGSEAKHVTATGGARRVSVEDDAVVYEIGSGTYRFTVAAVHR